MTTIYAISSGEYSDYHIEWLFESKEDAEDFINRLNEAYSESFQRYSDYYFIEEFEVLPKGTSIPIFKTYSYSAQITDNGEVTRSEKPYILLHHDEDTFSTKTVLNISYSNWRKNGHYSVSVMGPDRDRVLAARDEAIEEVQLALKEGRTINRETREL